MQIGYIRIVSHGCLEDFAGFDGDGFEAALAQDMEAEEFVFGVKRNDPELFDWFVIDPSFALESGMRHEARGMSLVVCLWPLF